ncbi:MAG: rhodanese-like domain-containing protein [Flavobacteriales bacterium]
MSFLSKILGLASTDQKLESAIARGALLVDVRTPAEFAAGTVKGAINIPYDLVSRNLKQFEGKSAVVVFCRSGARSAQAKSVLDRHRVNNVINGGTWQHVADIVNRLTNN